MGAFFHGVQVNLWTEISVFVFVVIFTVISFWVYMPARKSSYERAARLPLDGELLKERGSDE